MLPALLLAALWAAMAQQPQGGQPPERTSERDPLILTSLRGKAKLRSAPTAAARELGQSVEVEPGATISAAQGGVEVDFAGGHLDGTARVHLQDAELKLGIDVQGHTQLQLERGRLFLDDHGDRIALSIASGTSTIDLVGTGVAVSRQRGRTQVYVERGQVEVRTGDTRTTVEQDHQLDIDDQGQPSAVRPGGGAAANWRWAIGRSLRPVQRYGLARCNAPELATPVALPGGGQALKVSIPDDRWVKLNYDGYAVRPGVVYSFRIKVQVERGRAWSDLFLFHQQDVFDFGTLKRPGNLWEGWQEYELTGRMPSGVDPARPASPRLSVQGPATLWVAEAGWYEYAETAGPVFLDSFGSPGAVQPPSWRPVTGQWQRSGQDLEATAPEGRIGVMLASQPLPEGDFHLGGRVEPGGEGEAGFVLGYRDADHYHAVLLRGARADAPKDGSGSPRLQWLQVTGGQARVIAETAFEPKGYATYMLDIHYGAGRLDVCLGNQRLLHSRDYHPAGKQLGLAVRGPGAQHMDNVLLRR